MMTQVLIGGLNPRDFTARGTRAPRTLGGYDGCTVVIRFTPLSSGTRHATLIIRANAVVSLQQVPLTGHGGDRKRHDQARPVGYRHGRGHGSH
jgi:hypothetical protein